MGCFWSIILIVVVAIISFIVTKVAIIRRDGVAKSSEIIHGLPSGMGFQYKNDCNDDNTWTG